MKNLFFKSLIAIAIWVVGFISYPMIVKTYSPEDYEKMSIFHTITTIDFLRADLHDSQGVESPEKIVLSHSCQRLKEMRVKYLKLENTDNDSVDLSFYSENIITDLNNLNISKVNSFQCNLEP